MTVDLSGSFVWERAAFALVRLIHKFFLVYNGEGKKEREEEPIAVKDERFDLKAICGK